MKPGTTASISASALWNVSSYRGGSYGDANGWFEREYLSDTNGVLSTVPLHAEYVQSLPTPTP